MQRFADHPYYTLKAHTKPNQTKPSHSRPTYPLGGPSLLTDHNLGRPVFVGRPPALWPAPLRGLNLSDPPASLPALSHLGRPPYRPSPHLGQRIPSTTTRTLPDPSRRPLADITTYLRHRYLGALHDDA